MQGTWTTGTNTWRYHFEYNDHGNGPWMDETVVADRGTIPVSVQLNGHDYFERPVAERYSLVESTARWEKGATPGTQVLRSPAFYLTTPVGGGQLSAVPAELAMLARALVEAPEHRIALLPRGEARLESTGHLRVSLSGTTKILEAVRITGLGSAVALLWLESDRALFAAREGPMTLIRRGGSRRCPRLGRGRLQ
ncbi:MAG TPA: hypothetical protein VFO44_01090 [Steroidobacteraceae bacterium]|nr:hypothetical protein [Steroidobacteraceae bacterium]